VQLQLFPLFELFGLFLSQIRLHGKFCPRQAQGFLVVHLHPPEMNIVLKRKILASKPKPVKQIRATTAILGEWPFLVKKRLSRKKIWNH
jgi:hypothetical protein